MKLIRKAFKAMLIYGIIVNFLFGFTTIAVENEKALADYYEAKKNGNKTGDLSIDFINVWKRIFKNLTEIKECFIRIIRAD